MLIESASYGCYRNDPDGFAVFSISNRARQPQCA